MKKPFCKYCILLAVAVLLFACFAVCAAAETPEIVASGNFSEVGNPNLTWTLDSEGTMILSGTGGTCSHDGYPYAVLSDQRIKKLIVEEGVTGIGDNTFRGAMNLESIVFPNSLTWIQWAAFESCVSLKTVEFGTWIEYIASNAFPISIDSVTNAYSLTQPIHFFYPGSEEDWSLVRDPMSVVYGGATELHNYGNAYFHYNVVDWGYCGGEGDGTNLMWTLDSEGTLTISGTGAMADYGTDTARAPWYGLRNRIQAVIMEDDVVSGGVTSIGNRAFRNCTSLLTVTLGEDIVSIGDEAFYYCKKLSMIHLPAGIRSLGADAFCSCNSISAYSVDPDNMFFSSDEDGCLYNKDKTEFIRYPVGSAKTSFTVPDTVTVIARNAFSSWVHDNTYPSYVGHLESITVPASVTRIGYGALANNRWSLRFIKILNPDCRISYDSYAYLIDGWQFPENARIYGYLGSTTETSAQDFYYGEDKFWPLCPTNDNHTVIKAEGMEATCAASGHSPGWYCEDCGVYLSGESIDPLNHIPGAAVTENNVPATCTEAGGYDEVVYCTQCPYEISRTHVTADPTDHPNRITVAATGATETVHGYTAGVYCPDCDTWLSGHEVIHNHLGEQTVIQEPTETEPGLVEIVCTVCGQAIRYTATWEEPEPEEAPGGIQGFWMRITTFFRGFIDWFLRLFRKP